MAIGKEVHEMFRAGLRNEWAEVRPLRNRPFFIAGDTTGLFLRLGARRFKGHALESVGCRKLSPGTYARRAPSLHVEAGVGSFARFIPESWGPSYMTFLPRLRPSPVTPQAPCSRSPASPDPCGRGAATAGLLPEDTCLLRPRRRQRGSSYGRSSATLSLSSSEPSCSPERTALDYRLAASKVIAVP